VDNLAYSGNGVGHINKVKLLRVRLVLGLVTTFSGSTIPLSLPIPPCIGAINTRHSLVRPWGRNGEFCVGLLVYWLKSRLMALAVNLSRPSSLHGL